MSLRKVWRLGYGRGEAGACTGVHLLGERFRPLFLEVSDLWPALGELQVSLSPLGGRNASDKYSNGPGDPGPFSVALCSTPKLTFGLHRSTYMWAPPLNHEDRSMHPVTGALVLKAW